ncbi:MAG TPA: PAS domain S-box protein [Methylovirgula sp.]|nr:PAS domain S-box protein [Methylovirgula sp.]
MSITSAEAASAATALQDTALQDTGFGDVAARITDKLMPKARTPTALRASPEFLEKLPLAIYACDAEGRILWYNQRAVDLWGNAPRIGDNNEKYCGSYKVYVGGQLIPRDEVPMAQVLRTGLPLHGLEGKVERPDGTCVWATIHIDPVEDADGVLIGAINCFHETTALRRAEDALREQDRRLAATLEHAGIGIYEVDAQGRLLRVNSHMAALMGTTPEELVGRSVFDETHADDVAADVAQFHRQAAGVIERYTIEKRIRRKDGSYFWASVTSSTVRDAGGNFLYAVRVAHDVTDRRAAESAAYHLAAIVESSEDAIISKDLNGVITTWNRGAQRIFGYTAAEAIGQPVTMLIPHHRLDEEPEILGRVRRGERIDHYETVRRRKDGKLLDISLTVSPILDARGNIIGASKIARDVTERKRLDALLAASERRSQELLSAIPAAIYTTDAEGKVTYYNQAAVDLAGRTPVMGRDDWSATWKLHKPDGSPLASDECPMAVTLKEGRPIRNAETIVERPDGTLIPVIPYPSPLRDESGQVVGAINMLVDVSERKQAETQQRILLNELNHRVKNNMQMLQSLLHTAARRTDNCEARRVLAEAGGRIAAMAAAQRILYATTDATRFDAAEFLEAVCETVRQTFATSAKVVCEADPAELSNDVAMPLALILNELLTNSIKHATEGRSDANIHVGLRKTDESFLLFVEDDGPGFDFEQVRDRSSGLRLVQGLARQLRGQFEVTTTPLTRCSVHFI